MVAPTTVIGRMKQANRETVIMGRNLHAAPADRHFWEIVNSIYWTSGQSLYTVDMRDPGT
jgi:hypothetical protein